MQSHYYIALDDMPPSQRADLETRLDQWNADPIGQIVVTNLRHAEFLLPIPRMLSVASTLWEHRSTDDTSLARHYRSECHKHVLQGGQIDGAIPRLVGRAVDREEFVERLYEWHGPDRGGPLHNRDLARDFVRRLETGDVLSDAEKDLRMSQYACWVTWNEASPQGDPFAFASPRRSASILASLGLAPVNHSPHRPLLLLSYSGSTVARLLKPTVADAGTYQYFQPPPPGAAYGRTRPWPAELAGTILATTDPPAGRPEALHEPIVFGSLLHAERIDQ